MSTTSALHEGQRGLCFVRGRQDDQIVLTTYGRSSGFCVDPIEKKPLNHFLPGTPVLSFGTAGCNLTCKFCQNWDISKARETVEHTFGTIKARMGATHFLMKRLPNVATEMALSVLAYNLTRAMNIVGIKPLIEAIGA